MVHGRASQDKIRSRTLGDQVKVTIPNWWVDKLLTRAEEEVENYFEGFSEQEIAEFSEIVREGRDARGLRDFLAHEIMADVISHMEEYFGEIVNDETIPAKVYSFLGINIY